MHFFVLLSLLSEHYKSVYCFAETKAKCPRIVIVDAKAAFPMLFRLLRVYTYTYTPRAPIRILIQPNQTNI